MKPVGMKWGYFFKKHYELWPLFFSTAVGMSFTCGITIWSCLNKDFIVMKGKFPWDKLDLLRKPYHRKLIHFHQEYDVLNEMDCLYREMDKKERERLLKKKTPEEAC